MSTEPPQKVLVTAGAGGIGRAVAQAFVAAGARVHVCDIDLAALNTLRAQLPAVSTSVCDVADAISVQAMMAEVQPALGGLDVLVNNAGVAGPVTPLADLDVTAWSQVLQVNLTGTFLVTQAAIPLLKQSGAASIVMMSSLAGRFGYPNRSPYATSKWGLIGLTKTLSRELGEFGIRVNAILPGAVEGPRLQQVFAGRAERSGRTVEQEAQAALANQSIKHFVDASDIADMAVFLASKAGRSISGQMLCIDGDSQSAS